MRIEVSLDEGIDVDTTRVDIVDNSFADTHLPEAVGGVMIIATLGLGARYALNRLGRYFEAQKNRTA